MFYVQNLHIIPFVALSFGKNVSHVFGDDAAFALEQFAHLFLRKPHCFLPKTNVKAEGGVWLVDDDFVFGSAHGMFRSV